MKTREQLDSLKGSSLFQSDMAKLFGWPPYDVPTNYVRHDTHFASSLLRKWGITDDEIAQLREEMKP